MLLVSIANDLKFHKYEQHEVVLNYVPADKSNLQRGVSWSRDGTLFSLATIKGNAEIIRTKEDVRHIQSVTGLGPISAITFQKTSKRNIAVGTTHGAVHIYDIKSRASKKVFVKSGDTVSLLEWNSKDSHLGVLTKEGVLSLYSNITNVKSATVEIKKSKTTSTFRFHQNNKNLLSCASDEGCVCVYDLATNKTKYFLQAHSAPVTDLVFSPQNDSLLISTSLDRTVYLHNIKTNECYPAITTHQPVSSIDIAPNGNIIAVGSIKGVIMVYDLRNYERPIYIIENDDENEIKRILFQPHDAHLTETLELPEETVASIHRKNSSVDSFASIINNVNEFSPKVDFSEVKMSKMRPDSLSDSFLASLSPAIKRNDTNSMTNLGITEGVKKWIDSKNIMDSSNPHGSPITDLHDIIGQKSSTPRIVTKQNLSLPEDCHDSPISNSVFTPEVQLDDVRKVIKETVREVIEETINDAVDNKMKEVMDTIHKYYLNLHISFCRQFVFQESTFKKLLMSEPKDSQLDLLREENEFLKKKLNEFMEKNK